MLVFISLAAVSFGGNLEDGIEAFNSGDFKKAYELYLIEAKKGNASAQTNLGTLYATGQGVPQDDTEAVKWFRKAASQGERIAQSNLGAHYAKGQGVPQNDKEAAKWFIMAAKGGDFLSQLSIGIMYELGRGVSQNHLVAWAWYTLAKENGGEVAQSYIESIQKRMSPDEIDLAKQITEQLQAEIGD
jgi:TPR repeat protein